MVGRRKSGLEPLGRQYATDTGKKEEKSDDKKVKAKGKGKEKADGAVLPITPDSSESKPKAKKARQSTASKAKSTQTVEAKPVKLKKKKEAKEAPVAEASASSGSLSPPPNLASGPKPHDPTKKQRPSHAFSLDSDSSLTDVEAVGETSKAGGAVKPKAKAKKDTNNGVKPTKKSDGKVKSKTKDVNGKVKTPVKREKGKSQGKGGIEGEKKVRAKPIKKPEVPVDPPVFEKVDTRLGRVEAEHRIMVSYI